ncbi:MAG: UDP-N-acetylglucosamine 4,6-dehydratase family protein [Aristaeellaceae bacterium]
MAYDLLIFAGVVLLLAVHAGGKPLTVGRALAQSVIACGCIFGCHLLLWMLRAASGHDARRKNDAQQIKPSNIGAGRVGGSHCMRESDIEELLFRKAHVVMDERTKAYYRDKVILVTGGGGSIGSELCRQMARMDPKQIIILDVYENGAYDVQQELKMIYGDRLDLKIEICSITNQRALERVFQKYHPQIIINAAAHKHVPLMENNCIEAIHNNVFGTKNLVLLCERYDAERFLMLSTDKAVNPTNVMGATKRMCEMIVQSASTFGHATYSATRFGNVLGSAGSVIPLFKRQIANGGPVTITDKRMIRYFMTIPEASQLVLTSGSMAGNGELFVLDMGQPVRILDLAESMIRLSGAQGIDIVEAGLRPGEKLYEELLVKSERMDKTDNDLIFIERDRPLSWAEIEKKLSILGNACDTGDDDLAREALRQVVPTFYRPEEINREVGGENEGDIAV